MTDEHDTDWVQASKAAAADLAGMILRNEKAKAGADWRERKCGECGYALEITVEGPRSENTICRKFTPMVFPQYGWFINILHSPACPDFIPREVTP